MLVLQKSRDNKNLDQATKHWWVLAWLQPCSDHLHQVQSASWRSPYCKPGGLTCFTIYDIYCTDLG